MQRYPYTYPGMFPPSSNGWRPTLHLGLIAGHFVALLPTKLQGPPDMEQEVELEELESVGEAESVATVEEAQETVEAAQETEPGASSSAHAEVEVEDSARVRVAQGHLARTASAKRASEVAEVNLELAVLRGEKGIRALTRPEAAIAHVEQYRKRGEEHRMLLTELGATDAVAKSRMVRAALSRMLHPDKGAHLPLSVRGQCEKAMKDVNNAVDVVTGKSRRGVYGPPAVKTAAQVATEKYAVDANMKEKRRIASTALAHLKARLAELNSLDVETRRIYDRMEAAAAEDTADVDVKPEPEPKPESDSEPEPEPEADGNATEAEDECVEIDPPPTNPDLDNAKKAKHRDQRSRACVPLSMQELNERLERMLPKRYAVAGDGNCWLYAVLASVNYLEHERRGPSPRDYAAVKVLLQRVKVIKLPPALTPPPPPAHNHPPTPRPGIAVTGGHPSVEILRPRE